MIWVLDPLGLGQDELRKICTEEVAAAKAAQAALEVEARELSSW